jgi:hypothetical protein
MSTRVKIYVRPTGDDLIGDGTSAKPFKSVARALRAVPVIDPGDTRFVIDNTGCIETEPIVFPPFVSGQMPVYQSGTDFASYYLEGYVTVQAVPTQLDVLNASTTTFTFDPISRLAAVQDTSKAWTADQFKGKWLVGSGLYELAVIAGNTPSTLDTTGWFTPFTAPVSIVDLSAQLNGGANLTGVNAPISLNGQRIVAPEPYPNGLVVMRAWEFSGLLCDLKGPYVWNSSAWFDGCSIRGSGLFEVTDVVIDNAAVLGYLADCAPDVTNSVVQGILENCLMPFTSGLTYGVPSSGGFAYCECRRRPFVISAGTVYVLWLKVDDVPGDAIIADGPGVADLYSVGTGPTVPGVGLHASNGAQIHVHDNVNPTGTAGDLKVGQNPVRTWTGFRTSPPVNNEIDQTPGTGDGSRVWQ